jgi:predicted small lipoprotein YifL
MIKKLYIILIVITLFTSCGKKGDPVYKEENQNSKILSTQLSTLS